MAGYYSNGDDIFTGSSDAMVARYPSGVVNLRYLAEEAGARYDVGALCTYDSIISNGAVYDAVDSEYLHPGYLWDGLPFICTLRSLRAFAKLSLVASAENTAIATRTFINTHDYPAIVLAIIQGAGGDGYTGSSKYGGGGGGSGLFNVVRLVVQPGDSISYSSTISSRTRRFICSASAANQYPVLLVRGQSMGPMYPIKIAPGGECTGAAAAGGAAGYDGAGGPGFRTGGNEGPADRGGSVYAGTTPVDGWSYPAEDKLGGESPRKYYGGGGAASIFAGGGNGSTGIYGPGQPGSKGSGGGGPYHYETNRGRGGSTYAEIYEMAP